MTYNVNAICTSVISPQKPRLQTETRMKSTEKTG